MGSHYWYNFFTFLTGTNPFSHYLAVERAIKSLEETGVITNEQFAQQKAKLFGELSSL